jgi:hypothetical protein
VVTNELAGWRVTGDYGVDVVSAASADIVATASRRWREVRHSGAVSGSYQPKDIGGSVTASISSEPDYLSLHAGGSVTQDLFDKTFTWLLGYDFGHDVAGRTGTAFSVFSNKIDRHSFKAGATFVLNRATVASFVFDLGVERGDQSKPYRYVPLFAPGQAPARGATIDEVTRLRVSERPIEQLPLARERYSLSGQLAHRFDWTTLRLDQRLYIDSWGMKASTTDARYLLDLDRLELGPHLRLHAQTPVSFWQRAYILNPGFNFPTLRTGDRELGPLVNVTAGGSARIGLGRATNPRSWLLGLDLNGTWTDYLDDLYVTKRFALVGGASLETEL